MKRSSKTPKDQNQRAKSIVDQATAENPEPPLTPDGKNAAAVLLGRMGGRKGGPARKKALTPERRAEIARRAAQARWGKKP